MVEIMKSSFIPKKEIKKKTEKHYSRGGGINIFFLISLMIFLMTVLGWVFVYFYKDKLIKSVKAMQIELNKNKDKLKLQNTKEFILASKRTKVGKVLLEKHYEVLRVLKFLEQKTLPMIYFDSMTITAEDDVVKFEFKGYAQQFKNLISQKELYVGPQGNPNIKDFMFTNITRLKEKAGVEFNMSFSVDKIYLTKKPFTNIKTFTK